MTDSKLDLNTDFSQENLSRENILELRENVYSSKDELDKLNKYIQKLKQSIRSAKDTQEVKDKTLILGISHWILGNLDEAIEALSDLKTRKIASYFLGKCYQELGDYERAIECFERSKHSDSEEFEIQMDIAETQRKAGDIKNALKLIQKLSKACDNEVGLHYQWAHCLDELGEYEDALAHYNRALEINPSHTSSLFRLAYNFDLYGDDEKAIEYYERCIEQVPTYINAIINLGLLYEDNGDYKKAISYYETALKANPNQERARLFLKDAQSSLDMYYDEDKAKKSDEHTEVLNIPISDFELSVRSKNCLERMNINTLADLTKVSEEDLLSYKNFGETSLNEIKNILSQKSLNLGQALEDKKPSELLVDTDVNDKEVLSKSLSELSLSTRCKNALEKIEIMTIGDLVLTTEPELLKYKGIKQKHIDEIKTQLENHGLSLKDEDENKDREEL